MGNHAHIEPGGYITIDHTAWLERRTTGQRDDLTLDLHRWAANHPEPGAPSSHHDQQPHHGDWSATARRWCHERTYSLPEPDPIVHAQTRLDARLSIVRATTAGQESIAIVGINDDWPHVYTDHCADSWNWLDADSIEINCPQGHRWTWRTGRELLTADKSFTTLTLVFGTSLDAPFTSCPQCTVHRRHPRTKPCPCGGVPWILCPTCQARCDVDLPIL